MESPFVESQPLLQEEDGAGGSRLDQQGDDEEERGKENDQREGQNNIDGPLHDRLPTADRGGR